MDAPFPQEMMSDIERFFKDVHPTLVRGLDYYPAVFDTSLFFPLQRQAELRRMIQTARAVNPKVIMEIGADKGGGLYHWCQCLPTVERVIGCEIRGTPYKHLFEQNFPNIQFLWGEGDSRDSLLFSRVMQSDFNPINILFIDGDKLAFEQDFDTYLPLMRKGGVVFMHDVQDREPRAAFERVKARGYRTDTFIDVSDAASVLCRQERGVQPANAHESWLAHWAGRSCGVGIIHVPTD